MNVSQMDMEGGTLLLRVPSRSGFLAGHCGTSVCTCVQHSQEQLLKASHSPPSPWVSESLVGRLVNTWTGCQACGPLPRERSGSIIQVSLGHKVIECLATGNAPYTHVNAPGRNTSFSFMPGRTIKVNLQIKMQTAQMQLRSQVTPSVL